MIAERVWADIDLDALGHNLGRIRDRVGPRVAIVQVVKADAYGHGAVAVAHHAVRCGVAGLGVGTSAEALELRTAGVRTRILVLGTLVEAEVPAALRHGIEFGIHSGSRVRLLDAAARSIGVRARVHLNVDTGMGRLGVLPHRAGDILEEIRSARSLQLAGIMTHATASMGALAPETADQQRRFDGVLADAAAAGLTWDWAHFGNSACVFTGLAPMYDAVRPGIACLGALAAELPGADELSPVMSLKSQVVFLKDLPAGTAVGYGGTWTTPRPTRLATLPLGFQDGLPIRLSNRGEVLIRGRRAPLVGRVTMDYATVDVTDHPGVEVGDLVTLIGTDGDECIRLEEVAAMAETIPYEVTCAVGRRVPRFYHGSEREEDWIPRAAPMLVQ